jgi:Fe-S cluster biosynthesis and repair protein YggX
MSDTDRTEQFRKMANDDPDNELAHFSLGKELLAAGNAAEAARSFQRVLALNANIAKAYELLADAQFKTGHRDLAIKTLTDGVQVAHRRGETMPKNAMSQKLRELNAPVPELAESAKTAVVGEGQVLCKRCGKVAPRLASAPFRNDFGKEIYENICASCWQEAIGLGTKVINELRLPMNDPQAHKIWDQHIREFLNLEKQPAKT